MIQIMKFEWKKIIKSKLNLTAAAAGLFLILLCVISWITSANYYDGEKGEWVYGTETIPVSQEKNRQLTEVLTEEFLTKTVVEIQKKAEETGAESADQFWALIRDKTELAGIIATSYAESETDWLARGWSILGDIPAEGGLHFYEHRLDRVREQLNRDYSYGSYTPEEKAFWMEKAGQVETPFLWGDETGMINLYNVIGIGFYLLFVVVIGVSPVFSSEYESGADSLLFTTRYGKTKLITAKIITALLAVLAYFLVCFALAAAVVLAFFGWEGGNLPIQLRDISIPYNWTYARTCAVSVGVMLLGAVAVTLFTLLLSARVKSSFPVLIIGVVLLIGPAFLSFSETSGLWNHILYLLPVNALFAERVIRVYNSYQIGGTVISYLAMVIIVYAAVAGLSLLGVWRHNWTARK